MTVDKLISWLILLAIVATIYGMWALVWRALFLPVKMKDEVLKERDEARQELLELQAAKAVEWDKYKEAVEERDTLRKAYFSEKEAVEKLKEERAKLQVDKDNLIKYNQEIKKGLTPDKQQA